MKPITLPPSPPGSDPAAQFAWIRACLQTIERASQEEPAQIFDSYSSDLTPTSTRQLTSTGKPYDIVHKERMHVVNEAYRVFRDKWDRTLPPDYPGSAFPLLDRLRSLPPAMADAPMPAIFPDPAICEIQH